MDRPGAVALWDRPGHSSSRCPFWGGLRLSWVVGSAGRSTQAVQTGMPLSYSLVSAPHRMHFAIVESCIT
jgi:hypothetical protein